MLNLFKNISIYAVGNIFNKGVTFFLLPFYTRVLQPSDYGKLELMYLVGSVLGLIYGLYVENGYSRIYFYDTTVEFRKKLFSTGQIFCFLGSIIIGGVILNYSAYFSNIIFDFQEGSFFLNLIVFLTFFEVMGHIPFNNLRVRQQARTYVVWSVIKSVVTISLTIYFVAFCKMGVVGVLYSKIIAGALCLLCLHCITWNEFNLNFSFIQLKLMLSFSVFLIPSVLSAIVLNMSNRYFIQLYQSLDDVGMYSLGAKLAGVIPFLFTEPIKKAFAPYLYEQIVSPEICKKTLADFSRIFIIGLSIVALSLSLYSRELIMIMSNQSYHGSHNIVYILAISYIFLGLAGIIVLGIQITRKTWIITIIWPFSAVINIALNMSLIPNYGRIGAAIATMLSVILINLMYLYALQKVYPVRLDYWGFLRVLFVMLLFNYVGTLVTLPIVSSIIFKTILIVLFVLILWNLGILRNDEKQKVKNFFLKKFNFS